MYPILFQIGPITIYSYGLMIAVAFITGTFLARQEAKRKGLDPEVILNLALGSVISGIIGARLLFIVQNLKYYLDYPMQVFMLHKGGLSFYGGLVMAIIFAAIFLKRLNLSFLNVANLICPYLALAQAIGRVGCLLNGCCYGIAGHPVQIYSSLSLLLIFVVLRRLQSQTFLWYCLLYSVMRFFMEFLRGDNLRELANLTLHQLISILIFVVSGIILWKYEKFSSASSA